MARGISTAAALALPSFSIVCAASAGPARAAEPVMVQCGREYQAAKAANALNGLDWNAFRAACASRLKAAPAAAAPAAPAATPAAAPAAVPAPAAPPAPAPTVAAAPAIPAAAPPAPAASASGSSAGTAAMHARQKQCGAEWTANKATLVAATPGLTWPKYWSQCNARIKASGSAGPAPAPR